ncbi:C-type lectin domain family 4 member K-like [Onychostoma macrolepis]|uniref:C-type lectin domain family 4 member K-like n=1 Tax=Onychostoma macrolepis TaxID=369639 RepID=UPI00272CD10F|nr:C-type lectin domain family 4 member K-like [Onychostoma macrolepis]
MSTEAHRRSGTASVSKMDSIYENIDYMPSMTASDVRCSLYSGMSFQKQEREREVSSPKWTKVLLTLLSFSLVFALGGLCALGMLYVNTLADLKSAQEKNSTMTRELELKTNYTIVKEPLPPCFDESNLSVDGWIAFCGNLYLFSSDKLNWSSSRDVCVSKGADLVTITSQSEQMKCFRLEFGV